MSELIHVGLVVSLLAGMVRFATPLLFGALGELVTERSGIMNLGIEGMMLVGAFTGFMVAITSGSLWLGLVAAIVAASLLGLVMAVLSATLRVDQVIAGLGINILASGTTFYLFRIAFQDVGTQNIQSIQVFRRVRVPLLADIPIIGDILFTQHILTFVALAFVPIIWFVLYRTRQGLELRTLGERPKVLDMRGLSVAKRQYAAVIFGSMMAGAGGAFLTLATGGIFLPDITQGRGFIAFALVIFGNWSPGRILLGAMLFGLIDSLQLHLQAIGVGVPQQLLLALPYLLTIVALVVAQQASREPLSLGIPYVRSA